MFEKEASSILKSRGEIINSEEQITLSIAEEFLPRENVLNEVYNFFRPRYVYNGEVNNYFDILWPNDRSKRSRDLIVNLLKKNDVLPFEKNTVCAMICLRLRCNLFHGVKELWTLRVQSQLFIIADYYLEAMIDRMLNPEAQ